MISQGCSCTWRLLGLPKMTRVFSSSSVRTAPLAACPVSTPGSNQAYRQASPSTAALRMNWRMSIPILLRSNSSSNWALTTLHSRSAPPCPAQARGAAFIFRLSVAVEATRYRTIRLM